MAQVFRRQTIERMSSPEQLSEYLRVSNPNMWVLLAGVMLLLVGLLVWSSVGMLESTEPASVVVRANTADIIMSGPSVVQSGMTLTVADREAIISEVRTDKYGRAIGRAEVRLPDGTYEGSVVTEQTHPIQFLLESR